MESIFTIQCCWSRNETHPLPLPVRPVPRRPVVGGGAVRGSQVSDEAAEVIMDTWIIVILIFVPVILVLVMLYNWLIVPIFCILWLFLAVNS